MNEREDREPKTHRPNYLAVSGSLLKAPSQRRGQWEWHSIRYEVLSVLCCSLLKMSRGLGADGECSSERSNAGAEELEPEATFCEQPQP